MAVDLTIALAAMQTELDALTRAVHSHQDAIAALTATVATLQARHGDADRR